jgi:iron complex outermembrane recepter protein
MSKTPTIRFFSPAALPAALCLAFGPAALPAFAADEATPGTTTSQLETVQVIGVKQPYRNLSATGATKSDALLKDLPQSVRVLSADMLQDAGVTKLADALDLGSGIAKQSNLGGLWDSYAIRGFTGDPNFGSDYMVNGFNYSRGYNGVRDAANTSTVEILKGPASALYGRGEPGGTVNLTTKKPLFQPAQTVELSVGSDGARRTTADLTGPISERFAYRLNAAAEKADSYRDYLGSERYLLSPSLIWMLTPDTTVSYELEVSKQRANFDRGVLASNGKLGVLPRSRFLGEPDDGKNVIETTGHQVFVQHYFNDDWSLQTGFSVRDSSLKGLATEGRYLLADQRTLVRQRRLRDNEASDVAGRLELLGKLRGAGLVHNVLVGIDGYHFTDERVQYRNANAGNIDIYEPVYGLVSTTMALTTDTKEKQRSHSVYAQDQIDLGAQWKMLLGLRYDKYKQSLLNHRSGTTTAQTLDATTPRVGLVYQPSKTLSLYATTSKSFRPNSGVSSAYESFPAEKGKAHELGAKLDSADGKISSTLALYKISKNNVLTPDPADPNNFSVAAGEVESQGLEFDLAGELMRGLRLSAAYAYTDAQVTEDNNAFLVGRQLTNVPKHSANLMLVKSFALMGNATTLGLGLNYVGEREGAVAPTAATDDFKLPAYTSVKLISSYQLASKLRLSLDIDNLFDKLYYASSYSQIWVYPGNGRKVTLTAQYKF